MFDFLLNNDTLSAIIAFILVLIPAVIVHEFGHFIAAKLVGITILEFGVGMPPRAVRLFRIAGTDYTLNWLPLGGFVRPLGEDMVRQMGDEATQTDRDEARSRGIANPKSVGDAKPLQRILFMAGGALANFIFAFVLFTLIALGGLPEVIGGRVNVLSLEESSPLYTAGLRSLDTIEQINGERFNDSADFIATLRDTDDESLTLLVRREGEEAPVTLTVDALPATVASADAPMDIHPLISGVAEGSPAETAGILPGDVVLTFNDEPIATFDELQAMTRANLDQQVSLTLRRNGEIIRILLTPRSNPPAEQGAMGVVIGSAVIDPTLGLVYQAGADQVELRSQPLIPSMQYALDRIGTVFNSILSIPGQILNGTAQGDQLRLTSPLGIAQIGGFYIQESIQGNQPLIIVEFIALINIALGITNLLPIPALDGGRIVFVLIEMVRRKPIAPEREGMVHLIGLALLLSMMVVVLLNDIANPLTDLLR